MALKHWNVVCVPSICVKKLDFRFLIRLSETWTISELLSLFVVKCGNVCLDCDCRGRFLSQLFLWVFIYYWCFESRWEDNDYVRHQLGVFPFALFLVAGYWISVRDGLSKVDLFSFAIWQTSKISRARSRVLVNLASGLSYFWRWPMKGAQSCTTHSSADFRSCGLWSEVCCLVGRDRRLFEPFQSRLGQTASRQRGSRGICSANIGQHTQIDKFTKLFCHFLKNTLLTISCLFRVVLAVYFWVWRWEKGEDKSDG